MAKVMVQTVGGAPYRAQPPSKPSAAAAARTGGTKDVVRRIESKSGKAGASKTKPPTSKPDVTKKPHARPSVPKKGASGKRVISARDDSDSYAESDADFAATRRHRKDEDSSDEESDPDAAFEMTTHSVSLERIRKRWHALSGPAQSNLQSLVDEAVAEVFASTPKQRPPSSFAPTLALLSSRLSRTLPKIRVPGSSSSGFPAHRTASSTGRRRLPGTGVVEMGSKDAMEKKVLSLESVVEQERQLVKRLTATLRAEKRALEDEEAELDHFEKKRKVVEREETKELTRKLHPLVRSVYAEDDRPPKKGRLSGRWAREAAASAVAARKAQAPARDNDDDEEDNDADEPVYQPANDKYLVALAKRLGPHLSRLEHQGSTVGEPIRRAERLDAELNS